MEKNDEFEFLLFMEKIIVRVSLNKLLSKLCILFNPMILINYCLYFYCGTIVNTDNDITYNEESKEFLTIILDVSYQTI
jgi:hypothetical protein